MPEFKAIPSVTSTSVNQDSATGLESVDVLLVGLKQRLEKQPDDVDGWILLSKSYYHLNRLKEAKAVFEKAKALGYTGNWKPLPRIDSFSQSIFSSQSLSSSGSFKDYKIGENITQTKNQYGATASQTESTEATGLKLKISLNPALQQELSPEFPVFIFVRAAENPGPPLAVVRKKVDELPFELVLNDSHAMMPGRTISSAENVIVGVRISISGNPERQPGDYEKLSKSIPSNTSETLELVITNRI
jgi:cytochrome c-type biogenesis protein CcmH